MWYLVGIALLVIVVAGSFLFVDEQGRRVAARAVTPVCLVLAIALTLASSFITVQPGFVAFPKVLGSLSHDKYYLEGPHFVNPVAEVHREVIRRLSLEYSGDNAAEGLTRDRVALIVDVTVPFILNPQMASRIYERYGPQNQRLLVRAGSRDAIRNCTSRLGWEEAVSQAGRDTMAMCIPTRLQEAVAADLMSAGFTEAEARSTYTFPNALVRKMVPREDRILKAVAEEQAAIVDLRRQETLTAIAREEANRRANEGSGIRLMMAELPNDFTVEEMVAVINANANKTSAEAFLKAVETGSPKITVITGGSVPVTASANAR
jgi:hypothetical protein